MKKKSVLLAAVFCTVFYTVGCGLKNPYSEHDKKCKFNCDNSNANNNNADTPRNHPRTTATQPTNSTYWLNIFSSSNVVPIIDGTPASDASFMTIIKTNPFTATKSFAGVGTILSRFRADIDFAKQMNSGTVANTPEDVRTCITNAFNAPWVPNDGTTVDFGKCIPLNHEMFTSNAQTSDGGILAYTEYEKTISFKSKLDFPQLATAFDLRNIIPFSTSSTGTPNNTNATNLEFNLSSLIVQTSKEILQKKIVGAVREWSFTSVGENSENPFKVEYNPTLQQVKLNGDIFFLQQSAYNPPPDNVFTGQKVEGNMIQITFQDFTITGSDVYPDAQLGYKNTASLGGSYLIAVNYAPKKANYRDHFIQVSGKNAPCKVDGFIVMIDENGNPIRSDAFPIDLCAAER